MSATSKGPEGHESHTVKIGVSLAWSKGAVKALIAAGILAAGGVIALLDKFVAALLPAVVLAILAVDANTTESPSAVGLQLPTLIGAASRNVSPTYDRGREGFRL